PELRGLRLRLPARHQGQGTVPAREAEAVRLRAGRGLPRNRGLPEEGDRGGRGLGANLLRRRTRGGERAAGSLPSPGLLRGPSAALLVGHMPTGMLPPRTLHPGPRRDDQALSGIRKARSGPACSLLVVATTAGPAIAAVERGR